MSWYPLYIPSIPPWNPLDIFLISLSYPLEIPLRFPSYWIGYTVLVFTKNHTVHFSDLPFRVMSDVVLHTVQFLKSHKTTTLTFLESVSPLCLWRHTCHYLTSSMPHSGWLQFPLTHLTKVFSIIVYCVTLFCLCFPALDFYRSFTLVVLYMRWRHCRKRRSSGIPGPSIEWVKHMGPRVIYLEFFMTDWDP